jgi:hypothetical protein
MATKKTKPEMTPAGYSGSTRVKSDSTSAPAEIAPNGMNMGDSSVASTVTISGMGDAAPSLQVIDAAITGIAAWQNNKKVTSLWSINQNRNSWINFEGIGWRKLANNSDSAIVALSVLGAHAKEKGSPVNYREENDGMIHEIYVW